ncbi:PREDICTED: insulin-degrading enzyme-like [Vollenhovia emeryi]|uniref:insulin-degrading enzyme-like n=1 Tax=Vollenhovia emeryi TaxID=411798 RepID=UPI0005F43C51|nr:PREDICTED: insulin-degrading enzyme-like [Vollenhovia emeryi]
MIDMSTDKRVEKRYNDIKVLESDDFSCRGLVLANKMKVLLISEPSCSDSGVVMDINIGSMNDPDDLPGLAHFCEHALILGTNKYPRSNDYAKYVKENCGKVNAETHLDHTVYYFTITPEKLTGALDRFAQLFLAPLFPENSINLELNAIHSEYEMHLMDDTQRLYRMLQLSLRPDHPYSKFDSGNKETLNILPKKRGVHVRNRLLEFHKKYYSASRMALLIISEESLDDLENMIVDLFSDVTNKDVEIPDVWSENPFKDEDCGTIWYIVPIQEIRRLQIMFPLPKLEQQHHCSAIPYITHLLQHKGKGSIFSALKAKNWCHKIKSEEFLMASRVSIYIINIDLTEEGATHIEDIIQLTFQYINMLKLEGPIKWIYDECKQIENTNIHFKENSLDILSAVRALQEHPMNDIFHAEHRFTEWRPDLIEEIMEYLTPHNIRIHMIGKAYESITNETEEYFRIKYVKKKMSKETMDMWKQAGYNTDLKLPSKNEFIATKFDAKLDTFYTNTFQMNRSSPLIGEEEWFPILIEEPSGLIDLFYKKNDDFPDPTAKMIFNFLSPIICANPLNYNLTEIFTLLLLDSLEEETYAAKLADLNWSLINTQHGIKLTLTGYDEKQNMLLEQIIKRMANLNIDPNRFQIIKECYTENLKNFIHKQPYEQAMYYLDVLLAKEFWHENELLKFIDYVSIDNLQRFVPKLFSSMKVQCYIYGNVTVSEVNSTVQLIKSNLKTEIQVPDTDEPLLPRQLPLHCEIKLENGCHLLFEIENNCHNSTCTIVYYATGFESTRSSLLTMLLEQIISEPCYNILRTNEQLGYIVKCSVHQTNKQFGMQGLQIIIQSDKQPHYVEKRIDSFLDSMLNHVSTMPHEEFEEHKETLCSKIANKVTDEFAVYWYEIRTKQYCFSRPKIEAYVTQTLTQQEFLDFYVENIHGNSRRKLSIHVTSTAASTEQNSPDNTPGEAAELSTDKKN